MKKIFIILLLLVVCTACKEENRTDYIIKGNAENVYNGVRVYLKYRDEQGQEIYKDTAIVMNGTFTMKGQVDEPSLFSLVIDGTEGELPFMLENSEIDIAIDKANVMTSKVFGSESNKGLKAFQEGVDVIRQRSIEVMTAYGQIKHPEDAKKRDSLTNELENIKSEFAKFTLRFLETHPTSYFSLILIDLEITNNPEFNVKTYTAVFENLSSDLKASSKGVSIKEKLDRLNDDYEKNAHLEIGNSAPNFEAPRSDGAMVSLEELKGKVTIVDFWAAWCGPCRRENPNIVKLYNEYHKDGLEIIGVSLDGAPRQKDAKNAWLDAIKKDKLTWHHVSNLNYFNGPVAKLYNINSIPATYILDENGIIVAKNLKGKALELKVKEVLSL